MIVKIVFVTEKERIRAETSDRVIWRKLKMEVSIELMETLIIFQLFWIIKLMKSLPGLTPIVRGVTFLSPFWLSGKGEEQLGIGRVVQGQFQKNRAPFLKQKIP